MATRSADSTLSSSGVTLIIAMALAAAACLGRTGSAPLPDAPPANREDVTRLLAGIRAADTGQLAISPEDGEFLRVAIAAGGTRRALEIGGASGYSAIWMGLGLRETGGTLVSIEYDAARAAAAQANVAKAGLAGIVTVIHGDAFVEIPKLTGTFDFVFLDAWKADYRRFFDLAFPRLDEGGVLLAHNVINKGDQMPDFLQTIHERSDGWSSIVAPSGEGISITYKRRRARPSPSSQ